MIARNTTKPIPYTEIPESIMGSSYAAYEWPLYGDWENGICPTGSSIFLRNELFDEIDTSDRKLPPKGIYCYNPKKSLLIL
jgi:hypothetical protein